MLIITNTIQVKLGHGEELASRFATGRGVRDMPGFIRLEVWHGTNKNEEEIKVCTLWEDEAAFKNWMSSDAFRNAHSGAGKNEFITGSYISKYTMSTQISVPQPQ